MTQSDYNAYSAWRANKPISMPFIAGGYTQADWDILNGAMFDREYYDDYCDTPLSRSEYIELVTKPYWA